MTEGFVEIVVVVAVAAAAADVGPLPEQIGLIGVEYLDLKSL